MNRFYIPLLAAVLLFVSVPAVMAQAIILNYNRSVIGEKGAFNAGAFMARADDSSAGWYNPAGLSKAKRDSISGNSSLYEYTTLTYGESVPESKVNTSANFLGSVTKMGSFAYGWSVVTPVQYSSSVEYDDNTDVMIGDFFIPDVQEAANISESMSIVTPGFAVAFELSPNFRLGLGGRVQVLNYSYQISSSTIQNTDGGDPYYNETESRAESGTSQFLGLEVGGQYDLSKAVTLAFLYRSPSIELSQEGKRRAYRLTAYTEPDAYGTDQPARVSEIYKVNDENLKFQYKLPATYGFAVAWQSESFQLEMDLKYYEAIGSYAFLSSSDSFSQVQDQSSTLEEATLKDNDPDLNFSANSVLYTAVGLTFILNETSSVHGGYFNDPSPVGENDLGFQSVDISGLSIGFSTDHKMASSSYGFYYLMGSSPGTADKANKIQYSSLGAVVAGSLYF